MRNCFASGNSQYSEIISLRRFRVEIVNCYISETFRKLYFLLVIVIFQVNFNQTCNFVCLKKSMWLNTLYITDAVSNQDFEIKCSFKPVFVCTYIIVLDVHLML